MSEDFNKLLDEIRNKVRRGDYYLTRHAVIQSVKRKISTEEIVEVLERGEIIEHYPEDKYGPSCLIFGNTRGKRLLHVVCSIQEVWIVTVYEPDPGQWLDLIKRR